MGGRILENLQRSVHIDAPIKQVFDYLSDPLHLLAIWPRTTRIETVEHLYSGRYTFDWTHNLLSVHFEGRGECDHRLSRDTITYRLSGGLQSMMTWKLEPEATGTNATLELTYTMPRPLQSHHPLVSLVRCYEQDADDMVASVKAQIESQTEKATDKAAVTPEQVVSTPATS
jgi:uncharacterized protein YndB with AHSA1/START domain